MIGIGGDQFYHQLGLGALQRVSELEKNRNQFNDQAKAAHRTNIMSGAMSGAMLGASVSGPYAPAGAAIGAIVGGLGGSFL